MGYACQKQTGNRNCMFHKPVKITNKTYKYGGTNLSLKVLRRFVSTLRKMSQLLKRKTVMYSNKLDDLLLTAKKKIPLLWLVILSVFMTNFLPLSPQAFCLIALSLHLT